MIILFDLDSTLCSVEWFTHLAKKKWLDSSFSTITERSMNWEINFEESFSQRLLMLEATRLDQERLWNFYTNHITPGLSEIISLLSCQWHIPWILTYSFLYSAQLVAKKLNIQKEFVYWNNLTRPYSKTDFWRIDPHILTDTTSKARIIKHLQKKHREQIVFVWDGYQDMISWHQEADTFIWFWWNQIREKVKNESEHYVENVNQLKNLIMEIINNDA